MAERKIPRTMSTQHPDNARIPPWCKSEIIEGDAEIYEAYFAYSDLGCHEVMWDSEGKDVDIRVVRKLLSKYDHYFKEKVIGRDVYLTYRVPNPRIEPAERKIVMETLLNILVGSDVASTFYNREVTPIFEVILPFTTDGNELIWLFNYYKKAIAGSEDIELNGSTKVKDWLGPAKPKSVEVIPLVEDMDSTIRIGNIVETYIDNIRPKYVRVFLARSDPALNYGLICAVILIKLALSKLKFLEMKKQVPIYPIIGAGSLPFRGHLSPSNIEGFLREYKGVHTATIQSALKYDCQLEEVKKVVEILNDKLPYGEAILIEPHEEKVLFEMLIKFKSSYQRIIEDLAPLINDIACYIPRRRARKLHAGLFGYSRGIRGVSLPRAIPFTGALYSLSIPPELIGLETMGELRENEWNMLKRYYENIEVDLKISAGYLSWQNIDMLMDMHKEVARRAGMEEEKFRSALSKLSKSFDIVEENLGIKLGASSLHQKKYENIIGNFLISYIEHNDEETQKHLLEAAMMRRALG